MGRGIEMQRLFGVGVFLTCALAIVSVAGARAALARPTSASQAAVAIAYVRADPNAGTASNGRPIGDIYVMNADGGEGRRLTQNSSVVDEYPAWSPDGGKIAFSSNRKGTFDIWTVKPDGSDTRRVSKRTKGKPLNDVLYDLEPAWSPDGGEFAFAGHRFYKGQLGTNVILVMNADGTGERRLALARKPGYAPAWNYSPTWSPDGLRIAFSRFRGTLEPRNPKGDFDVWTMNADGSHQHHLRDTCCYAAWSPDGEWIAYMQSGDVYVMRPNGSDKRRVTKGKAFDVDPAWSPDGAQLAFASDRSGNFDIWAVNVDGSSLRRLTQDRADEGQPAWSPVLGG
jgi:Tol biopolymer transport system component